MNTDGHAKITASQLKRNAYLYVRQSTLHQVLENTESTKRQYALRDRAVALGWPLDRVMVIDCDLGLSAASADRAGFRRLVTEVGLGHAGLVLGLEVSRLARNSADWHRLLEICALTNTLLLDEDGVYDPSHFNDRLLLGLKGTMSEAELHILRARLKGGILSKASRGELRCPLPVGFGYNAAGRVELDPNQQVQQALRVFFDTFRRTGSAWATVRAFNSQALTFPCRVRRGVHAGHISWGQLTHSRALRALRNPRYAGAFCFGRTRQRSTIDGRKHIEKLPQEEWFSLIPDTHPGYISWDEYHSNLRRLRENTQPRQLARRSPAREGPALLQGMVICGVCGRRMTVRYHDRGGRLLPDYLCQQHGIEHGERNCQQIPGAGIDAAVGELLVESITPQALELALQVQQELIARLDEADRLRRQQVERARYEADLAQRRYLRVDPDNRLVAASLEADWNQRLRDLDQAQQEYARQKQADQLALDVQTRTNVLSLATGFRELWQDPATPDRERKRMARLLLEDVTLFKQDRIKVCVRFKTGVCRELSLAKPLRSWETWLTPANVVSEIDQLLGQYPDGKVAEILNGRGLRSGGGLAFDKRVVASIRLSYGLADHYTRLKQQGKLTREEIANLLGVVPKTVQIWTRKGLIRAYPTDCKGTYLYDPPGEGAPRKWAPHRIPVDGQPMPDGKKEV